MEYNTTRPKMIIPEYGRHIQKMVDYATNIEDKEERNKVARAIISVMGQLNPHLRDVQDFKHKLWDHLFIMSDFNLDVDSPYDRPEPEILTRKPDQLNYPANKIRYKHYGKIIENMIKKAVTLENPEERMAFTMAIANLMKRTYLNWNSDSVNEDVIISDLRELSNGELTLPQGFEFEATNDILARNTSSNKKKKKQNNQRYRSRKKH